MKADDQLDNGRRGFLKAAGIAAAGSVVAGSAMAAGMEKLNSASWKSGANSDQYDVVVLGAGFAGLVAARDCSLRGLKVLVIEARNRIGGRTFTSQYHDHRIELGGTWIHQTQPFVWSEVRRYGLAISESPGVTAVNGSWLAGGKLRTGDLTALLPRLSEAFNAFCDVDGQGGRSVFPRPFEPLYNRTLVEKFDNMTLQQRLDQVNLDPEMRDLVNCMVAQNASADPAQGAFLDQLHWYANCDYDLGMLFDRCGHYKIADGMEALAKAILDDSRVDLLLASPVKKVLNQSNGAVVTLANGRSLKAREVICAVPMNCLTDIEFSPALSPAKTNAANAKHVGNGIKVYAHVRQKIGVWLGLAPYPNPIIVAFTEEERQDGTLLVLFVKPDAFDPNDKKAVQAALRTLYPDIDVIGVASHHWAKDPYAKGTWAFYQPGQMLMNQDALRATEGHVHFASGDIATGWHGFVDGALQSGVETARAVCKALKV